MGARLLIGLLLVAVSHCDPNCPFGFGGLLSDRRWRLLDQGTSCGRSFSISTRVMGGVTASPGEYPWLAHLVYDSYMGHPRGLCGGSLINDRYILTAAHCCLTNTPNYLKAVRLGQHARRTSTRGAEPRAMTVAVSEITPHGGYDATSMDNDICLVRLAQPVQFNDIIRPICLPNSCSLANSNLSGLTMEVAGWGHLASDPVVIEPTVLQKLEVQVADPRICRRVWRNPQLVISSRQLCAGGQPGRDVCGGDSGGPLMLKVETGDDSTMFLMGLVSYGERCARHSTELAPGIYTRVAAYLSWILDNIRE